MGFRAAPAIRASIVRWAELQPDNPTLSEAIRRLVELGLLASENYPELRYQHKANESADKASKLASQLGLKVRPTAKAVAKPGRRSRAQELARDAIEKMGDPTASPDERDQRRRRLTRGPEEFRKGRVDQPKAKGKG